MRFAKVFALSLLAGFGLLAACGDSKAPGTTFGGDAGTSSKAGAGGSKATAGGAAGAPAAGGAGDAGSGGEGGEAGTGVVIVGGGGSSGGPPTCQENPDPNFDNDGDGWTPAQGDCNDCDKNVNPGALDIVNYEPDAMGKPTETPLADDKQIDEDCNGKAVLPSDKLSCDAGLGPTINDAMDAAKTLGLCNVNVPENPTDLKEKKWGVIAAAYSDIAGQFLKTPVPNNGGKHPDLNFGSLPDFGTGTKPREGERIFALSSGEARTPSQMGFTGNQCSFDKGWASADPPGFPKNGSCGSTGNANDGVALDLMIRVPTNAHSMKFNFRFFSCEYPMYACESFNDAFAVLMYPSPLPLTDPMAHAPSNTANIAFEDAGNGMKNVIGVNNPSFFTACNPGPAGYVNCKGEGDLKGSGFEGHGGSAWLASQVPVPAGQIILLRFAIWDSTDGILDSTAVADAIQWSAEEGTGVTTIIDPEVK
jgi:hypothetical protein